MKNIGTPQTLIKAIENGLARGNDSSTISSHVRDFFAQLVSVEMINAETEETVALLKRLMARVDHNPRILLVESRKVNREIRDAV